ncbi:MAG: hypothetical protein WAT67_01435 [Candidatus Contendobacter sp.]|jgi:hypothetical protein
MSGKPIPTPAKVELVAWSGDVSQLAARLCLSEPELTRRLKALAAKRNGPRLVVMATPANSGPILAALARRLFDEGNAA